MSDELRQALKLRGLSAFKFSKVLGITPPTVNRWLRRDEMPIWAQYILSTITYSSTGPRSSIPLVDQKLQELAKRRCMVDV